MNGSTKKTPFHIVTRMIPKGTIELRDLNLERKRSAKVEGFLNFIKTLHEQFKRNLEDANLGYKQREDKKKRPKYFKVDDKVMTHLNKIRFLVGTYSNMKMKKFIPCKILSLEVQIILN